MPARAAAHAARQPALVVADVLCSRAADVVAMRGVRSAV